MRTVLGACLVAASLVSTAEAQVARVEFLAIPSITISDSDFLNGKRESGSATVLGAMLRLPRADAEKVPAVVLLHASGGIGGSGSLTELWASELNAIGLATLRSTVSLAAASPRPPPTKPGSGAST